MIAVNDKSERTINFDQNSVNESTSKNFNRLSFSWPSYRFLWISMIKSHAYYHIYVWNSVKFLVLSYSLKWGYIKSFWIPLLVYKLMTSWVWLIQFEPWNQIIRWWTCRIFKKTWWVSLLQSGFNHFCKISVFRGNFIMVEASLKYL